MSRRITLLCLCAALLISAGCHNKKPAAAINFAQELPPGQLALRKISPAEYPDFAAAFDNANIHNVEQSINQSLLYLQAPSSRQYFPYLDITHDKALATLRCMKELVQQQVDRGVGGTDRTTRNQAVAERFDVYKSIGAPRPDNTGYTDTVLFTGYFTPIYDASLTREGPYQYPLYKRPADLSSDPTSGVVFGRKMPDGSLTKYPARAEIESSNLLAGQELVWLKDRLDAYVVQVQGSARLRLTNGQLAEVGYAGNNGYDAFSIAKQMKADGALPVDQELSLRAVRGYFQAHPEAMDKYLPMNPRFIFFQFTHGGPYGSIGVPVTPFASIATDKSVYPRAMPAFLVCPIPSGNGVGTFPFRGFMLDQDTGGAIRAAGRCDLYMGVGSDAEKIAGQQLYQGELYYLAVKDELVQKYLAQPNDSPTPIHDEMRTTRP